MRPRSLVLAVLFVVVGMGGAFQSPGIPGLLENPEYLSPAPSGYLPTRRYLWVATEEMFNESGAITEDPDLLPSRWQGGGFARVNNWYEQVRAGAREDPCLRSRIILEYVPRHFGEVADLEDLAAHTVAMVRGTVVATTGGFLLGWPGVMLTVVSDGPLVRAPQYASEGAVSVFYPAGPVPFGIARICHEFHGSAWPPPPEPGADVVVLVVFAERSVHPDVPIVRLDPRGYEIVYEANGAIHAAPSLRDLDGIRDAASVQAIWERAVAAFDRRF